MTASHDAAGSDSARLLDGRILAGRLEATLAAEVATFASLCGRRPRLVVVLVGDVAASASYVKSKAAAAARVGIDSTVLEVPASVQTDVLVALVQAVARDEHGPADGILVQLPLPPHIDTVAVLDAVPPDRDVDGFHPENAGLLSQGRPRFIPCTAAGVQRMLIDAGIETAGKHAVIIGRSDIVGKPLALLLASRSQPVRGLPTANGGDATVTICHSRSANLAEITRQADILVAAVGKPGLVTADMVKPGAAVVDVGINRVAGKLVGDVEFDAVRRVAGWISPVPGGVGPLTVAMLMANTAWAAELRLGRDPRGQIAAKTRP
jgi:methylenetetrahydrofolate dehydrogenase (NADP+)/methenyltetrahydrofolate cyclohydrolase